MFLNRYYDFIILAAILAAILDFSKCSTMPELHPMDSKSGHIVEHVYAKTFYAYYKSRYFASHPDYG